MNLKFFDIETGGLSNESPVLSVGIVTVGEDWEVVSKEEYNLYQKGFYNDAEHINRINMSVHKQYEEFFWDYMREIYILLNNSFVAGHNIRSFDCNRLAHFFGRYCMGIRFAKKLDTMQIVRLLHPEVNKNLTLSELAGMVGVAMDESQHHGALYDAEIAYEIAKKLNREGVSVWDFSLKYGN